MSYEEIPLGLYPKPQGRESAEITEHKQEVMLGLLRGVYDDLDIEYKPTALDFQWLPAGSKGKDFLDWIKKETGISSEIILNSKKENETKEEEGERVRVHDEIFDRFNKAYLEAKEFLENVLKYSGKESEEVGPESLSSVGDIFNLLRKTVRGGAATDGLSQSATYCRLVKVTLAAYETLKHNAELLERATSEFKNDLISKQSGGTNTPLASFGKQEKGQKFFVRNKRRIQGKIIFRGKDYDRALLRFLTRPEANAETALKDGIASRVVVDEKDAVELIPIISRWLISNRKVKYLNIDNSFFLSPEQLEKVKRELSKNVQCRFIAGNPNKTSMGVFRALKITGVLFSEEGEENKVLNSEFLSPHARQFEIQFVSPNNRNEEGGMNHHIYDVVKLMTARTRLDGGCSESVFEEFIEEAVKKIKDPKLDARTIKDLLTKGKNAPIARVKKNGKILYYAARSVHSRLYRLGLEDPNVHEQVLSSR